MWFRFLKFKVHFVFVYCLVTSLHACCDATDLTNGFKLTHISTTSANTHLELAREKIDPSYTSHLQKVQHKHLIAPSLQNEKDENRSIFKTHTKHARETNWNIGSIKSSLKPNQINSSTEISPQSDTTEFESENVLNHSILEPKQSTISTETTPLSSSKDGEFVSEIHLTEAASESGHNIPSAKKPLLGSTQGLKSEVGTDSISTQVIESDAGSGLIDSVSSLYGVNKIQGEWSTETTTTLATTEEAESKWDKAEFQTENVSSYPTTETEPNTLNKLNQPRTETTPLSSTEDDGFISEINLIESTLESGHVVPSGKKPLLGSKQGLKSEVGTDSISTQVIESDAGSGLIDSVSSLYGVNKIQGEWSTETTTTLATTEEAESKWDKAEFQTENVSSYPTTETEPNTLNKLNQPRTETTPLSSTEDDGFISEINLIESTLESGHVVPSGKKPLLGSKQGLKSEVGTDSISTQVIESDAGSGLIDSVSSLYGVNKIQGEWSTETTTTLATTEEAESKWDKAEFQTENVSSYPTTETEPNTLNKLNQPRTETTPLSSTEDDGFISEINLIESTLESGHDVPSGKKPLLGSKQGLKSEVGTDSISTQVIESDAGSGLIDSVSSLYGVNKIQGEWSTETTTTLATTEEAESKWDKAEFQTENVSSYPTTETEPNTLNKLNQPRTETTPLSSTENGEFVSEMNLTESNLNTAPDVSMEEMSPLDSAQIFDSSAESSLNESISELGQGISSTEISTLNLTNGAESVLNITNFEDGNASAYLITEPEQSTISITSSLSSVDFITEILESKSELNATEFKKKNTSIDSSVEYEQSTSTETTTFNAMDDAFETSETSKTSETESVLIKSTPKPVLSESNIYKRSSKSPVGSSGVILIAVLASLVVIGITALFVLYLEEKLSNRGKEKNIQKSSNRKPHRL